LELLPFARTHCHCIGEIVTKRCMLKAVKMQKKLYESEVHPQLNQQISRESAKDTQKLWIISAHILLVDHGNTYHDKDNIRHKLFTIIRYILSLDFQEITHTNDTPTTRKT
jgi:hypothetical protein